WDLCCRPQHWLDDFGLAIVDIRRRAQVEREMRALERRGVPVTGIPILWIPKLKTGQRLERGIISHPDTQHNVLGLVRSVVCDTGVNVVVRYSIPQQVLIHERRVTIRLPP